MTASPFGQPEPLDPAAPPTPPVGSNTRRRRRALPIVAGVVLASVAFAGGFAVASATTSRSTAATGGNGGGDGNGQGFGPGASGRPRNGGGGFGGGGFGGGASGTVGSVSADQMTISTQAGGSRIVLLTPTTMVTQVTSATKATSDITSGETVTVVGTTNPDGSVTATRIIIGDAGLFGRGGNGGPGNASPSPSSAP
jgi:hypothetical protein